MKIHNYSELELMYFINSTHVVQVSLELALSPRMTLYLGVCSACVYICMGSFTYTSGGQRLRSECLAQSLLHLILL